MEGNGVELIIGIDTGGTFTDMAVIDKLGHMRNFKAPSTPDDPAKAVLAVLDKAARSYSENLRGLISRTRAFVTGTTISTNCVLQHKGAKTGLLTTAGFRDVLEIRRARKENVWDLKEAIPPTLAPRTLRLGLKERIDANGKVVTPLEEGDVRQCASQLVRSGVESIAVCLLFSFLNDIHERRVGQIIRKEFPSLSVSLSCEVSPTMGDYERTSTTVVNAYVQPLVSRYLTNLVSILNSQGFQHEILIMENNGGCLPVADVALRPVTTLLSGPASGPSGAMAYGALKGIQDLILIDIGGTSFDTCFVKNSRPISKPAFEVGGYAVNLPAIDIHTIGAGGGSIAFVDPGGVLHVGPGSAGAYPGPACYGYGGTEPTLTDVCLVLGYINPENFLGGELTLHIDRAQQAIQEKIASILNMSVIDAAAGVIRVAIQQMSDAIREVSILVGEDPRSYTLVAVGGAGPMFAGKLAEELGIREIYVPRNASTFCAFGELCSDIKHEYIRTHITKLDDALPQQLEAIFNDMESAHKESLISERLSLSTVSFERGVEMRYIGQRNQIFLLLPDNITYGHGNVTQLSEMFHQKHLELFGFCDPKQDVEVVNIRLMAIGKRVRPKLAKIEKQKSKDSSPLVKLTRETYFQERQQFVSLPVYDGNSFYPGDQVRGPAIIEEPDTTVVIYPYQEVVIDEFGNYLICTSHYESKQKEGK